MKSKDGSKSHKAALPPPITKGRFVFRYNKSNMRSYESANPRGSPSYVLKLVIALFMKHTTQTASYWPFMNCTSAVMNSIISSQEAPVCVLPPTCACWKIFS